MIKEERFSTLVTSFVLHAFKGHLVAAVCTQLDIRSKDFPIKHDSSLECLEKTALAITKEVLYPSSCSSDDGIYSLHRSFIHMAFLYSDLRTTIRFEDGVHIIRHWQWWIPQFLATGCKNYALEAANHLVNIIARFTYLTLLLIIEPSIWMESKAVENLSTKLWSIITCKAIGIYSLNCPDNYCVLTSNRVVKLTLLASGANATQKHIEAFF